VRLGERAGGRTILIDAGIGPRAAARVMGTIGVALHEVSDVLVTHLDYDHFRHGWMRQRDFRAVVHLHRRHWPMAESLRPHRHRVRLFDAPFEPLPGLVVDPLVQHHDEHGVVAFRLGCLGGDLGFATDLGRVTPALVRHFQGVRVLAIESNYCPRMQEASPRPEFLKRRIMGGSGHLSNEQCAQVAAAVAPRHVVLLHLSRQCNTPELALAGHAGRGYRVTLACQTTPTGWVGAP
jgi:phosphoribosyl 1,2-cyclic phosphodiesterase